MRYHEAIQKVFHPEEDLEKTATASTQTSQPQEDDPARLAAIALDEESRHDCVAPSEPPTKMKTDNVAGGDAAIISALADGIIR